MFKVIDSFSGEYAFLSNFHHSPYFYKDVELPTVEHGYQADKATNPVDWMKVACSASPAMAKRLGRSIKVVDNWEEIKVGVMYIHLQLKFSAPIIRQKLLNTGDATLVEGNWWNDKFWGVCNGEGKNMLGTLLMNLREEISRDELSKTSDL